MTMFVIPHYKKYLMAKPKPNHIFKYPAIPKTKSTGRTPE